MTRHISLNVQASVGLKDFQDTVDMEVPDDHDVPQVIANHLARMAQEVAAQARAWERETFDNDSGTD